MRAIVQVTERQGGDSNVTLKVCLDLLFPQLRANASKVEGGGKGRGGEEGGGKRPPKAQKKRGEEEGEGKSGVARRRGRERASSSTSSSSSLYPLPPRSILLMGRFSLLLLQPFSSFPG